MKKSRTFHTTDGRSRCIGVVIPVLDDAECLERCLTSLQVAGMPAGRVIVADGGSHDGSPAVAARFGVACISSPPGRARQLAAGVAALPAEIDTIVLLHADTRLTPCALSALAAARANGDDFGCYRRRFDGGPLWQNLSNRLAAWRAQTLGMSFGDQVQWIDRTLLERIGGIPQVRHEDLALGLRAHEEAGTTVLPTTIDTCGRRIAQTPLRTMLRDAIVAFYYKYRGFR